MLLDPFNGHVAAKRAIWCLMAHNTNRKLSVAERMRLAREMYDRAGEPRELAQ